MVGTKDRALSLLGSGVAPVQVAAALGISESAISQLLSQEDFAAAVALKRYENLAAHTTRDSEYDSLEDQILAKLKDTLSVIFDPMKLVRILQIVNAAKRRGASSIDSASLSGKQVVQISLPSIIMNQIINVDARNQVVAVGEQALTTMQNSTLLEKVTRDAKSNQGRILENPARAKAT